VPLAVRKAHDLVFERRTVARSDPADLTVEERRLVDVRANEIVDPLGRVQQMTGNLRPFDGVGLERERSGRLVAVLGAELRKV
jgi:hypothetical protein